jgi:tRNA pseudouridine synthase 10
MFLCKICNSANGNAFPEGDCHICRNGALRAERMAEEAASLMKNEEAASFSISTIIPRDWLAREEEVWDRRAQGAESVKSMLNRRLVSSLRAASGLRYEADGDCRAVLDYSDGSVRIQRNELFVFGRYIKLVPGLSQSRWKCSRCDGKGCPACHGKGKMYESVEERIGEPFREASGSEGYVMHASGREDVDATDSAGRPFVLEVKGPRRRRIDLGEVAASVAGSREVEVRDLTVVRRSFVEVVTESHFDKVYVAETEFAGPLSEADAARIRALEGKTLLQRTPERVAHRRADLVRHRKVKRVMVSGMEGNRARLTIKAEAGTYIKEFISGDHGRTEPSVSGELGYAARCVGLDVSEMDDGFLDFCLRSMAP